jgi:hypothetical protein
VIKFSGLDARRDTTFPFGLMPRPSSLESALDGVDRVLMNEPAKPVAPVRRIIAISLRFHSPAGVGEGGSSAASQPRTFGIAK